MSWPPSRPTDVLPTAAQAPRSKLLGQTTMILQATADQRRYDAQVESLKHVRVMALTRPHYNVRSRQWVWPTEKTRV